MNKWILYTTILGFTAYWASNLVLWFPWSYNTTLGIILMLTLGPVLWAFVMFLALKTYPETNLIKGAGIISILFIVLAVVLDYIFFGLIRNAMEQLYQPTTFYGYGFLLVLPFIIVWIFKNRITQYKKLVTRPDLVKTVLAGISCFGLLTLIIIFT